MTVNDSYKTFRFHGVLREQFGKEWRLQVSSVQEGMRLLAVQIAGLEQFFLNAHLNGLRFAVFIDHKTTINEAEISMNNNSDLIRIVPIVEGAGGGSTSLILGAVLIASGVGLGLATGAFGASMFGFAPTGTVYGLIGSGAGLALGGITQMMMPKAQVGDINTDGNKSNYGFGSAVTTIAQGNPVPILYGQREIGGFVISAGQYPEDKL